MTTHRSTDRRTSRRRHLVAAGLALLATTAVPAVTAPAHAATVTPTLAATPVAGNPTVTFTGAAIGAVAGDPWYLCFGDEAVPCDSSHSGSATSDAALATGVTHAYTKAGSYTAVLYVVDGGTTSGSTPLTLAVTVDPVATLAATTAGLTATLDGSGSSALVGDTWWACYGDVATCGAASPDAHGTVATGNPVLPPSKHSYPAPGTYPASVTVVGPFGTATATKQVTVAVDPTAVLTATTLAGPAPLGVGFDGSGSTAGTGDTWALCYGDRNGCSASAPDAQGNAPIVLPATQHTYAPGTWTATLWVANGPTVSSATQTVAVTVPAPAPDGSCALSGAVRSCDLFAKAGTTTVAGTTVPFWGFTTSDTAAPAIGGTTIVATEGEVLRLTVHDELDPRAGNVAVSVPSLPGAPDLTGAAPGGAAAPVSFTLTTPGTFVYQAGLTAGGARQVAMGLAGVIVVRPGVTSAAHALHCAYDAAVAAAGDCTANHDPGNYFDREKTVVVNEVDPDFNADPFGSDTSEYHPTLFFLDGVAWDPSKPALDPSDPGFSRAADDVRLDAAPGDVVLLRYADLGLREHSLGLDNLTETVTANDGNQVPATAVQDTDFLNAGQSSDAFVTVPADAPTGAQFPLFDAGWHLTNGGTTGIGGMYTYLDVVGGAQAADVGPVGSGVTATPTFDPSVPSVDNSQIPPLTVTATFTPQPPVSGPTPGVASVGWALDAVPAAGVAWQPSGIAPTAGGAATGPVTFVVPAATLTALLGAEGGSVFGDHTVWLQATDSNGKVGPPVGATFTLAMRDPVVSALSISPAVTNGSTGSAVAPVASTTVAAPSDQQPVTTGASTLTVASAAGFPGSCTGACTLTAAVVIATGPSAGRTTTLALAYTGVTASTFTGLTPVAAVPAGLYRFRTGGGISLGPVPVGYVAVDATAAASLPGWVVHDGEACVVHASGPTPVPGDGIDAACNGTPGVNPVLADLSAADESPVTSLQGFVAPPVATTDHADFWVVVRALEGPDGATCSVAGTCRWSPWVYFNPTDPSTYAPLRVVTAGPVSTVPVVTPNPENGSTPAAGNLGLFDSFEVAATVSSPWADIALAEAFVAPTSRAGSAAPPTITQCPTVTPAPTSGCVVFGRGAEMTTPNGLWGASLSTSVTAFIPLSILQGMSDGLVRVWVHGRDVAGNWGPITGVDLILDRTAPAVTAAVVTPTVAPTASLAVTANDVLVGGVASGITGAEWWVGTDPGPGQGTPAVTTPSPLVGPSNSAAPVTFTVTGVPRHSRVGVRVRDAAGNWSTGTQVTT